MQSVRNLLAGLTVGLLMVSTASLPALAHTGQEDVAVTVPALPSGVPDMGVSNETLVELSFTQTDSDIDTLLDGGLPVVALVGEDGTVIAAVEAEAARAGARAISPNYPYTCAGSPSSACLYTLKGSVPYKGTGTLNLTANNVTVVAAGDRRTKFTRNTGTIYDTPAYGQFRMTSAATIVRMQR